MCYTKKLLKTITKNWRTISVENHWNTIHFHTSLDHYFKSGAKSEKVAETLKCFKKRITGWCYALYLTLVNLLLISLNNKIKLVALKFCVIFCTFQCVHVMKSLPMVFKSKSKRQFTAKHISKRNF